MSELALKACPFCGWQETPQCKADHLIVDHQHHLQCRRCKAVGPGTFSDHQAAQEWNRRAPSTPAPCPSCGSTNNAPDSLKCDDCKNDY